MPTRACLDFALPEAASTTNDHKRCAYAVDTPPNGPSTPPVRRIPPFPIRMSVTAFFLLLLSWPLPIAFSSANPNGHPPHPLLTARASYRNVPPLGFYDPRDHNGSWLTVRLLHTLLPPRPSLLERKCEIKRMGRTRSQSNQMAR
jgi:hypothetical protein